MLKLFYKVLPLLVAAVVPLRSTIYVPRRPLSVIIINHQKVGNMFIILYLLAHTHILARVRA